MTAPIGGDGGGRVYGPRASDAPPGVSPVVRPAPVRDLETTLRDALAGTGLDAGALLAEGGDVLVVRVPASDAAVTDGLERARGALVRGAPHEVLAALDSAWAGASTTPAGWYYRAAALALLGLPGESERVLAEGLPRHADAAALPFAQSVIRLLRGDASGARRAHAEAGRLLRPGDAGHTLLRAWDAVLRDRAGDRVAADTVLDALLNDGAGETEEALVSWARRVVRRLRAEATRAASLTPVGARPVVERRPDASARLDAVDGALRRLGVGLAGPLDADHREDALSAVRAMLQAFTTGGTLWDAGQPARTHAARVVLTAALRALAGSDPARPEGAPPMATATPLAALLGALFEGRTAEARAGLARVAATEGPMVAAAAATLLDGATSAPPAPVAAAPVPAAAAGAAHPRDEASDAGRPDTGVVADPAVPRDDLLLAPLRFGLVLVPVAGPRARRVRPAQTTPVVPEDEAATPASAASHAERRARVRVALTRLVLLALLGAGAWWVLLR